MNDTLFPGIPAFDSPLTFGTMLPDVAPKIDTEQFTEAVQDLKEIHDEQSKE